MWGGVLLCASVRALIAYWRQRSGIAVVGWELNIRLGVAVWCGVVSVCAAKFGCVYLHASSGRFRGLVKFLVWLIVSQVSLAELSVWEWTSVKRKDLGVLPRVVNAYKVEERVWWRIVELRTRPQVIPSFKPRLLFTGWWVSTCAVIRVIVARFGVYWKAWGGGFCPDTIWEFNRFCSLWRGEVIDG